MTSLHQSTAYIGRFAPSPTGSLHSGSLVTALASFLDARNARGTWFVRIDNIDPLRTQPNATDSILSALDAHQLYWDGDVVYQSHRIDVYQQAIATLFDQGLAYYCNCSRQQLKGSHIYPGTCRQHPPSSIAAAVRVVCQDIDIDFKDQVQGLQAHNLMREAGDFVIYRKDGLPAYQLATAIDDAAQCVTHVVRGCDLLDSTFRQLYLQKLLKMKPSSYAHIPILAKKNGQKLSKQNFAVPLDFSSLKLRRNNLLQALGFLKQSPPRELQQQSIEDIISWAITHWLPQNIPAVFSIKKEKPDF